MATGEPAPIVQTDLFLSYNRQDQQAVLAIRQLLELRGIRTFLDRDHLVAGLPWPQALEHALKSTRAVAVFLGPHDFGLWQKREMFFALDLQVQAERERRTFPVIPVLLRDAQPQPGFIFLNSWADFRNTRNEADGIEALVRAIERDERSTARAESSVCPYLGLRAFREEDQAFYFGREAFVEQLINNVSHQPLVAVVGPSGSGKSSVVLAGLLPRLRRQRPPLPTWDAISITPGENPWLSLADALVPLLEPDLSQAQQIKEAATLASAFLQRNGVLAKTFKRVLERSRGTDRLLVVVDQFEEMFTLAPSKQELEDAKAKEEAAERKQKRAWFLEDLLSSAKSTPVNIVLTLRADYYGHALNSNRGLSDALNTGQVSLGPMLPDELRLAVTGPAKLVGLDFDPGLINRILSDIGDEPGNLPLLQYALTQLWNKRRGGMLTSEAYDGFSGVAGAIGDKADSVYDKFSEAAKKMCRALFGRLVRVSPADTEGADTRQRAARNEIGEKGWQIALQLAAPEIRLLVIARDLKTGQETAEVAHEALIRSWKKLRDLLREDRGFLLWRQQFEVFISIWLSNQGPSGASGKEALLRGPALEDALKWRMSKDSDLNARERDFIIISNDARRQSGRRQLWVRVIVILFASLVVVGLAFWQKASQETREAQEIVDAFHQGSGHEREEYEALWRLSASRSDRTIRTVFVDFLSTQDNAGIFNQHSEAIRASLGLRMSSLDALRSVSVTGPCVTLAGQHLAACSTIAQFAGEQVHLSNRIVELMGNATGNETHIGRALAVLAPQIKGDQAERLANRIVELMGKATGGEAQYFASALAALALQVKGGQAERLANRIAELMGKATGVEAANLGSALAALAPQIKGDQAERLANRIVELMGKATGFDAAVLGSALAALAPQIKGGQAERGANRIVELMDKATGGEAANLGSALVALAPQIKGDQAERGANRIVELMDKATGGEAANLGSALAALAPQIKGDQAERGANRIVELMGKATGGEAANLGSALAALAPQLKGGQAERGANRIVELMDKVIGVEAANLGSALAALAPQVKGDRTEREALLTQFVEQRQATQCDALVKNMEKSELLIDMLKWPICESRDAIMLRITELQGARPSDVGEFSEPGNRSTFHADLRRFIAWLKMQRNSNGKPFDVDGPPAWSPGRAKGSASPTVLETY